MIGGCSTPRPGRFTPGKRASTRCKGRWVDPRDVLDGCGKSRHLQPVASLTIQTTLSLPLIYTAIVILFIQGVTGGTDQTSGECSLGQTIPI
jgi:hypothetical protein